MGSINSDGYIGEAFGPEHMCLSFLNVGVVVLKNLRYIGNTPVVHRELVLWSSNSSNWSVLA